MAKEPGAEKTASGLIYIQVKEGTGARPKATDTVKVHYHGTLRDGTVFDSSVERGSRRRSRSTASSPAGPRACRR